MPVSFLILRMFIHSKKYFLANYYTQTQNRQKSLPSHSFVALCTEYSYLPKQAFRLFIFVIVVISNSTDNERFYLHDFFRKETQKWKCLVKRFLHFKNIFLFSKIISLASMKSTPVKGV